MGTKRRIGIVGGSSQIARSLLPYLVNRFDILLYSRNPAKLTHYLSGFENVGNHPLDELGNLPVDVTLNCMGCGDPKILRTMGEELVDLTGRIDRMILSQLGTQTQGYIFLSSVAVYGEGATFPVNPKLLDDSAPRTPYGLAKRQAEQRHEAHGGPIVDLRIFGYASPCLGLETGFLLAKLFKSCKDRSVFTPQGGDFLRDYIGPDQLALVISDLIDRGIVNERIDVTSKQTISRNRILELMQQHYNLNVQWKNPSDAAVLPLLNRASLSEHSVLQGLTKTSAETVSQVAEAILR